MVVIGRKPGEMVPVNAYFTSSPTILVDDYVNVKPVIATVVAAAVVLPTTIPVGS